MQNVTVWCPSVRVSVCPIGILTVTHQGAACDVASVHTGSQICSMFSMQSDFPKNKHVALKGSKDLEYR